MFPVAHVPQKMWLYPVPVTDTMKAIAEITKAHSNTKSRRTTGKSPFTISPTSAVVIPLLGVPTVLTDENHHDATASFFMTVHGGRV